MLKGICPEVIDMLKDKIVSSKVFSYLTRMKPERQIGSYEKLMFESKVFSTSFARSIWIATPDDQLAIPRKTKKDPLSQILDILQNWKKKLTGCMANMKRLKNTMG